VTSNRTRIPLLAALLSTVVMAAACGSSTPTDKGASAKADATVNTGLLSFDPKQVQIKTGQTVAWVGGDDITHVLVEGTYEVGSDGLRTMQTDDKVFNLSLTKKGQQVTHTYDKAGTFTYFCTIHHGMNGTVVVS
jgi:plastocyanin